MGWYNTSWKNRLKITVDHTKVGASLTNFPVYVNLADLSATFFTDVQSTGADIRITESDGTTELAYELVSISTSGKTGELHFNANSLSNSADTIFYIYFNNPSATAYAANATYGKYNVWDSNYVAVYHMNDGADSSHVNDSTSNQITVTKVGAGNPAVTTSGKLGSAQSFNGTNSYMSASSSLFNALTGAVTLETWAYFNVTNAVQEYFNKDSDVMRLIYNTTPYLPQFTAGVQNGLYSASPSASTWYYQVGTYDLSNVYAYYNGIASSPAATTSATPLSTGAMFFGTKDGTNGMMNGLLDEMRISKIARASTWISTQYNNQNSSSTFYTAGGVESNSSGALFFAQL